MRVPRANTKQPQEKYSSDLAGLGIEFGPAAPPQEPRGERPREYRPPTREQRPAPQQYPQRERPPVLKEVPMEEKRKETPVSLTALKTSEEKEKFEKPKHARAQVDIEELRHAISESLSKAASETEKGGEKE